MIINFQQLRAILKGTGIKVYRDNAPSNQTYPYILYEFVNEQYARASNRVVASMPLYQISIVSDDVESVIQSVRSALDKNGVIYSEFTTLPFDMNDLKVTQYVSYVRCVHDE